MYRCYRAVCRDTQGKFSVYNSEVIALHELDYSSPLLMGQSQWFDPFVNGVCFELLHKPAQVAWVSNCAEDNKWYEIAWRRQGERVRAYTFTLDNRYLINHTTKEYINCKQYYDRNVIGDDECIHPLPLLTACGYSDGFGEYHGTNKEKVGSWAYGEISIQAEVPDGYEDITDSVGFIEA